MRTFDADYYAMSVEDIAAELGLTPESVRIYLSKAYKKIRKSKLRHWTRDSRRIPGLQDRNYAAKLNPENR